VPSSWTGDRTTKDSAQWEESWGRESFGRGETINNPQVFSGGRENERSLPQIYNSPVRNDSGAKSSPPQRPSQKNSVTAPISPCPRWTPPDDAKHGMHFDNGSPVTLRIAEWWGISRLPHMAKSSMHGMDSLLDHRGLERMERTWGSRDLGFEDILSRGAWCPLHFHESLASSSGGWEKVDSTNRGGWKKQSSASFAPEMTG
jgi:hypothetical protein